MHDEVYILCRQFCVRLVHVIAASAVISLTSMYRRCYYAVYSVMHVGYCVWCYVCYMLYVTLSAITCHNKSPVHTKQLLAKPVSSSS